VSESNFNWMLVRQSKVVKIERIVEKEDMHVTRVLFCGPHFPDSYNFTREYLQPYPFIKVQKLFDFFYQFSKVDNFTSTNE
jgi:hypothetical protein